MAKNLDPAVNKWLALKAAVEAANDAASGGGGATTPPTTPTTGATGAGGRADAFENNNAARARRGQAPLTYQQYITGIGRPGSNIVVQRAKGGVIPSRSSTTGYIGSGFINAPTQEGVPALLHGGEYIVNARAVSRLGIGAL